jgi:hypothetical protein
MRYMFDRHGQRDCLWRVPARLFEESRICGQDFGATWAAAGSSPPSDQRQGGQVAIMPHPCRLEQAPRNGRFNRAQFAIIASSGSSADAYNHGKRAPNRGPQPSGMRADDRWSCPEFFATEACQKTVAPESPIGVPANPHTAAHARVTADGKQVFLCADHTRARPWVFSAAMSGVDLANAGMS